MLKRSIFFNSLIISLLFLSACGQAERPPKAPKEMVQDAFQNSQNVKASNSDVRFDGSITGKSKDDKSSKVDFDVTLKIGSDIVDPKMPIFTLSITAPTISGLPDTSQIFWLRRQKAGFWLLR